MPIKVGIVGVGRSSEDLHLPAITKMRAFELVGIHDIDKRRSQYIQQKFGGKIYSSYLKMITNTEIDLIIVVTPSNTHYGYAIQALNEGKNVVVDKPTALSLTEVDSMFEAADKNGVFLTTYQSRRWDGDFLTIKSLIEKGALGQIFLIESKMMTYGYGDFGVYRKWRLKRHYGGGMLYDWGPHLIDQVLLLVKSPIICVWGNLQSRLWSKEVDDHFMIVLQFKNGLIANIVASGDITLGGFRWFIAGEKGALQQEGPWSNPIKIRLSQKGEFAEDYQKMLKDDWDYFYRNIAKVFTEGAELAVKPEETRRVMQIIDAARESSKMGNVVRLSS